MQPETTTKKLYTYEDYLKIDDANQYELIGGKLILVPAPRTKVIDVFVPGEKNYDKKAIELDPSLKRNQ